jgi:hypothetical protein
MLIEPDYRGELTDGRWDAKVRIRRLFSEEEPYVEVVTCRKLTADVAGTRAAIWAKRWVDLYNSATVWQRPGSRPPGLGGGKNIPISIGLLNQRVDRTQADNSTARQSQHPIACLGPSHSQQELGQAVGDSWPQSL